ncbi:MAG: hypothetical protein QW818_00780 [Candidatus Aenigmatarchaeota archaeon]
MKLNKKQKFILIVIVSLVAVFGSTGLITYYITSPKPITKYNFYGAELKFRHDLREAKNISVYPDEETILNAIWNPDIINVSIAYVNSSDNSIVAVNAFEITFKLGVGYSRFNWFINFVPMEVESFENLKGSKENLIIALIPPSQSKETKVKLEDNVIYITGKTNKELDLATMKFLMSALNITV